MKRRLKMLISLSLRGYDVLCGGTVNRFIRQPRPACVVLYYHAVPSQHRELFAQQMEMLLRLAEPLSTESPSAMQPGKRYVAVSFDDGFVSVLENAAPELRSRGIPWTMFVPSGLLGQRPAWLRKAHPAARQDRVMTAAEIRSLAESPLVTIGSHTVNHAHLVEVGPAKAAIELAQSKSDLEGILNRSVTQFSYPFGARTPALDQQAFSLGYRRLFSTAPEPSIRYSQDLVIGRVAVDPDISPLEFRLKVLGAYRWIAKKNGSQNTPTSPVDDRSFDSKVGLPQS